MYYQVLNPFIHLHVSKLHCNLLFIHTSIRLHFQTIVHKIKELESNKKFHCLQKHYTCITHEEHDFQNSTVIIQTIFGFTF